MAGWAVNDEVERIWKKAVTAYSRYNSGIRLQGGGREKYNQEVRTAGAAV